MELRIHPHNGRMLRATADFLLVLAGIAEAEEPPQRGLGQHTIHPDDNPATGAPPVPPLPVIDPDLAAAAAAFTPAPSVSAVLPASVPLPPPIAPAPAVMNASATLVPPAPPAAASAPPAGVKVDDRGIPWDSRIHSTPATLTDKGVWRKKRALNDAVLVARVEAELLAALAAPPAAAVPVPPAAVPVPVPPAAVPVPPAAVPVPPAAVPVPVPPAADAPTTLPALMQRLAPLMALGTVTLPKVNEACQAVGVPALAVLGTRADLVPSVWAKVNEALAA